MNKREKRLLIVTLSLVGIWVLSLLIKSDSADADAAPSSSTETVSTPTPAANAKPSNTGNASSTQDPNAKKQPSGKVEAFYFRPEELNALVELRRTSALFIPPESDPFAELEDNRTASGSRGHPPLPRLKGLYRSGGARGALLDDEVCFEGDSIGVFDLIEVSDEGVVLEYKGRRLPLLPYDPMKDPEEDDKDKASKKNSRSDYRKSRD